MAVNKTGDNLAAGLIDEAHPLFMTAVAMPNSFVCRVEASAHNRIWVQRRVAPHAL